MKRTYLVLQMAANVAVIVLAVLATIVFFKQYVFIPAENSIQAATSPTVKDRYASLTGKVMPIYQADWRNSRKTLVLYLSTTCHFCKESSPFYKNLVDKARGNPNVRIVAMFPQGEEGAKEHLKKEGIQIDEVYSGSLESIGVTGTPTIMLVNPTGTITNSWLGRLPAEKEEDVVNAFLS